VKIRTKQQDGWTQVRVLIEHPMDTGRQRDESTHALIPAHFIRELKIEHHGKVVVRGELSTAIAKDPYFSVRFRNGRSGDKIRVTWVDNWGISDSAEAVIS
jgi:sulfur-oxidizing protein SoxZ